MKKLASSLCCFLLLVSAACSKKEDSQPSYAAFTNVPGTLAVSKNGAASYNLTNLQLRVTHNTSSDAYEYRGTYNNTDGVSIVFSFDPKRTNTAASWIGATYTGGFSGQQGSVEGANNATYANPGPNATGTFSGTIYRGTLK